MKNSAMFVMMNLLHLAANGQVPYMKSYSGTGTVQVNLLEMANGDLLTGMARGRGITVRDPLGNVLRTHSYEVDTFLALQSIAHDTDSEFYFVGTYRKDSCPGPFGPTNCLHPVVGRMDSTGEILSAQHYVLDNGRYANNPFDLILTDDQGLVTWGAEYSMYVLKTDLDGDLRWAHSFSATGSVQFVKEVPNGDLLAGINALQGGVVIARLNGNGEIIWSKSYIRPRGMVTDALVLNDGFLITGFTDSLATWDNSLDPPAWFHPKLFILKLNINGEVQWCKGYDSERGWVLHRGTHIARSMDEQVVLLSNLRTPDGNRPFLMKTDMNGDTLWTRSVGANNYSLYTMNLLAYSDGGFIYNGEIWGSLPDNSWNHIFFFRTDAEGHLPCEERYYSVEPVNLFPTDSAVVLNYTEGAQARPVHVSDYVDVATTHYDACLYTGIEKPYRGLKPRLRPNPTSGRITVEFADPLMAESYYSVYDTMGKLLLQRPLPTGATLEEVDLGRFGAGTYAIKFTSPNGVCYEKVMVE